MKKYILASSVLATSVFAADNAQIIEYFKTQVPPEIQVSITKNESIKGIKGYELVNIHLSNGVQSQDIVMFSKDNLLFPEIIDLNTKQALKQNIEKKAQNKKLKNVYSHEDSKNIINIGNDPKKENLVIFSDPECPWCRKELAEIESRLQNYNVKMILTPVHGKSSLEKAYLIYKNINTAKTDADKIKLIRKYYDKNVDISKEKVTDDNVAQISQLIQKYSGTYRGVPHVVEEKFIK